MKALKKIFYYFVVTDLKKEKKRMDHVKDMCEIYGGIIDIIEYQNRIKIKGNFQ